MEARVSPPATMAAHAAQSGPCGLAAKQHGIAECDGAIDKRDNIRRILWQAFFWPRCQQMESLRRNNPVCFTDGDWRTGTNPGAGQAGKGKTPQE